MSLSWAHSDFVGFVMSRLKSARGDPCYSTKADMSLDKNPGRWEADRRGQGMENLGHRGKPFRHHGERKEREGVCVCVCVCVSVCVFGFNVAFNIISRRCLVYSTASLKYHVPDT